MQLIFLGTGAGKPSNIRNVSAIVLDLLKERSALWLFDCGEATQHQFLHAKLSLAKLQKIFITHLHGDHLFGLPGILTSRSLQENMSPMTVYGPVGLKQYLETVIAISHSWLTYPLEIVELEQGGEILADEQFSVQAELLAHRIPCFGYRITEQDKIGALDKQRLQQEDINPGPLYAQLKQGQTVTLADGRTICGQDYLLPATPGKVVTILGDTQPCGASLRLARDADLLVHEATQEAALQEKASHRGHSTTFQAADIARRSGAKRLIITHISPRYSLQDNQRLLQESQKIFSATEIATDFSQFVV